MTTSAMADYLNEIGKHPLLTKEEEVQLAKTMKAGVAAKEKYDLEGEDPTGELRRVIDQGRRAKKKFIESNLRLVVSIATKVRNDTLNEHDRLDLIQEGNIGLERAVDKFDHTKGFKFSTYATNWIRQSMSRSNTTLAMPSGIVLQVSAYEDWMHVYRLKSEHPEASPAELASRTGIKQDRLLALDRARGASVATVQAGDHGSMEAEEVVDHSDVPEEQAVDGVLTELRLRSLGHAMKALTPQERWVLHRRFLSDDKQSYARMAKELDVSGTKVADIERAALAKLAQDRKLNSLNA